MKILLFFISKIYASCVVKIGSEMLDRHSKESIRDDLSILKSNEITDYSIYSINYCNNIRGRLVAL